VSHPPPPRMHRHRLLPAARRRQSLSRLWGSWVIEPECMNTSVCMYVCPYVYIYTKVNHVLNRLFILIYLFCQYISISTTVLF
jgi:hypothetical protein